MLLKFNVYPRFAISLQLSNLLELLSLTLYILVSSADNLCKQFRPRSDPKGMIWIQTAWHSTDTTEIFFLEKKQQEQKNWFWKKYQQTTKPWLTSQAKRVDELKWKVLHVHAGFMLKPYISLLSIWHGLELLQLRVCVHVCVKVMMSEVRGIDFRWISRYRYSCRLVYIIIAMQIYHV